MKSKQYQQSRCDEDKGVQRNEQESKEESGQSKRDCIGSLWQARFDRRAEHYLQFVSKTRQRRKRYLTDIGYIKDSNWTILTDEDEIKARWKEYVETLNVTTVKDGNKQSMWTGWFTGRSDNGGRIADEWTVIVYTAKNNGKWYPRWLKET